MMKRRAFLSGTLGAVSLGSWGGAIGGGFCARWGPPDATSTPHLASGGQAGARHSFVRRSHRYRA